MENHLDCPVKKALEVLGGKWKLRIIYSIGGAVRRYGELKRLIPEISEKMLIQELKELVEAGLLDKKAYPEIPPRVEYTLTSRGKEALPILDDLIRFGADLLQQEKGNSITCQSAVQLK